MRLVGFFGATILCCAASTAFAQDPRGRQIAAPAGYLPGTAIYCDDGTNHAALCSFGGSGGGASGVSSRVAYVATASGSGYAIGDQIVHMVTTNPVTGAVQRGYWVNVTQETVLSSAPSPTNLAPVPVTLANTTFGASQAGAWNVGITGPVPVTGTFWQATQPVSLASLPLPGGAATATGQATNTAAITATQAATGSLAATSTTVTATLPQLTTAPGLAIAFGTTAATLFNANSGRHFVTVQVQGAPDTAGTNGCWINGTATATADANSLFIPRGGYFESSTHVGTGSISIICSAAAMAVYARQG